MNRLSKLTISPLIVLALILSGGASEKKISYPEARRGDTADIYHGRKVADPYRWMEDLDSGETTNWVKAQNAIARPFLENLARREEIKERLTRLWNYERYGIPFREGGRYFYTRNDGLQNQSVLYVADSLGQDGRVLIDPNRFSEDATVSLAGYSVSPDGRKIAYATSDGGTDWKTWKVREVATGRDYDEKIEFTKFAGVSWTRDSEGFYYSRHPQGADGKGDGMKPTSIYYHRLGRPQKDDRFVYSTGTEANPYPRVSEDGRYLIITVRKGFNSNAVYARKLDGGDVFPVADRWDALYGFVGNRGDTAYFRTNQAAPRSRLIAIDLSDPRPGKWREIIAEAEETVQAAGLVGGRIVARYLKDAHTRVEVFDLEGRALGGVELPGIGTARGFGSGSDSSVQDDPETFFSFDSYTSPGTIFRYDLATGKSSVFRRPRVQIDMAAFRTRQVFYRSKDGTRVPMFITHRKGIELDGRNPTLLYGYGGFDISLTPSFSVAHAVWLEMGGVLAIPNLRGGGEYGEKWHLSGTKLEKQNVFDDFIAAAEYLIDKGYTSSSRLAIRGGSNGGLLVGACMTQRPELFAAALPAVGVLDMLRYHTPSANARHWSSDYGLSENPSEFEALLAYSPYHNVKPETCYPPTLVTTADHDDRVVPWHSYKFGAALQHAQSCGNPILVRVETRAGHGAGKPTWMRIEEVADQWAFLTWALEME